MTLGRDHPLRKLFDGAVEHVFMVDLGICDPRLSAYVGDILAEFVHMDHIFRMHTVDGQTIREVSRLEAEAYLGPHVNATTRTRVINRYIGDFTLFWAGVYPESLRGRGANRLGEYLLQGKRSYGIAGELSDGETHPPAEILRRLSDEFEACVHGLRRVRESWTLARAQARDN